MSGQTMELLSAYRDRIVECAGEVAETFGNDHDMAVYMAGVKMGADALMYAGLCDGIRNFEAEDACSHLMLYTAFTADIERVGKGVGHEGNAEPEDPRVLGNAS